MKSLFIIGALACGCFAFAMSGVVYLHAASEMTASVHSELPREVTRFEQAQSAGAFDTAIVALNWVMPVGVLCAGLLLLISRHEPVNAGLMVLIVGVVLFATVVCLNLGGDLEACGRGDLARRLWW